MISIVFESDLIAPTPDTRKLYRMESFDDPDCADKAWIQAVQHHLQRDPTEKELHEGRVVQGIQIDIRHFDGDLTYADALQTITKFCNHES